MKILYVGHYNEGSTSKMRGQYLQKILQPTIFKVANIDVPMNATNKVFRTIGWRYKKGPLISNINNYIIKIIESDWKYDLVWIDKGVFINPTTIKKLKANSSTLIHFTPDPAFFYHQSNLFYQSLSLYDYCITSKSFEIKSYEEFGVKTIFCTQGFDPIIHKPYHKFDEKKGVVFIGHREESREQIIANLIESNIPVTLAGIKWKKFIDKYRKNKHLNFKGDGLFGVEYAKEISGSLIGLGLLSKWIPELHTTRTFEIPACGTALLTEKNSDTSQFFNDEECLFYNESNDIVAIVKEKLADKEYLQTVSIKGHQKIINSRKNYFHILEDILLQINLK